MFIFQIFDDKDNVMFFETENYTEGCIIAGGVEKIKSIRIWNDGKIIRDERRYINSRIS